MGGIAWDGSDRGDRVQASRRRSSGRSVALYIGRGQQTVVKSCCWEVWLQQPQQESRQQQQLQPRREHRQRLQQSDEQWQQQQQLRSPAHCMTKRHCCQVLLKATGSRCAAAGAEYGRGAAAKRS
ncbi:hypothetical protein, conserved [Eimeria tenella]|uniref:Uncharacterized protein n=1 Tax=Eimeria tenella TaxID=5802 RepID=U6KWS6_EIMTE|nr:hypothetical protein, conserved [Eimeria tenella]CDJ39935.1 hypothetical protein, conserved [Eimeria tenella]|eukprot:XP_013230688.1 hypothetical protein, conserved [Eimeria tenella]